MSQDTLFSITPTHRTKLEVWKERYGVITQFLAAEPPFWDALYVLDEDAGKGYSTIIGESHHFYRELGRIATGETEEEACQKLAMLQYPTLPFLESITPADCRIAATEAK